MCVLMMLLAIACVALQVGDELILSSALIGAGAVLYFFVWNFPSGLIFLGDGGAYLLGLYLEELAVPLLHRNPGGSPIFTLLLCAYPIFESIFTRCRCRFVRGVATGAPGGIRPHTLIHRRLVYGWEDHPPERRQTQRNSRTSRYLAVLCLLSVIPAVLWWNDTAVLTVFLFLFMGLCVLLCASIVRFGTPKRLVFPRGGQIDDPVRADPLRPNRRRKPRRIAPAWVPPDGPRSPPAPASRDCVCTHAPCGCVLP